jgi:two-component system, OmpR family, sensor histidine kinase ChvG
VSLRIQLFAFGLLTLVLPWTGFRYVAEMEAALRGGLEQSLVASATTVAAALEEQGMPLCPVPHCVPPQSRAGATIYAAPLRSEPQIDGVRDTDWNLPDDAAVSLGGGHRLWAGVDGRFAYLFVAVRDEDLVYPLRPGEMPYGDRVVLATEPSPEIVRWLLLGTGAPGTFRAQETAPDLFAPTEAYDTRVLGAWQETAIGYSIELRVPLNLVGAALAVGVIDVDRSGSDFTVALDASWDEATSGLGRFVYQRPELESLLGQFGRAGGRFRVLDTDGWVLSDAGSVELREIDLESASWVASAFRWALRRDDPPYPRELPYGRVSDNELRAALRGETATAWYGDDPDRDAIVAAAVPIRGSGAAAGAVLLEQASDPILTLTNQALVRLMTFTLLASVLASLGLLGYATWLSLRVRRLAHAAETALGPQGEIRTAIPGRGARDEIGDLARSFTNLLERLRDHTEYLRTLASKLSHELRTPLAVVTTSLDNLEHEVKAPAAEAYLARLRQGAGRLDAILAAMSEATELERAINDTRAERFDLAAVVASCCQAYRDVYPEREFECRVAVHASEIVGSGELVAQLLDKLVDNAVSFSASGSRIEVELAQRPGELELRVTNRGQTLPAKMRSQLFDSLVSIRDHRDGRPHLGLGLHIVALIAKFHGGRAEANDLPDASGVAFSVFFPVER